jgi:hypothetical protein
MTLTLTDGQQRLVGTVVRWFLLLVCAPLIKHNIVDQHILGVAVDETVAQVVGYSGTGLTLVWGLVNKLWTNRKIATALAMPPSSTEADLKTVMKTTQPGIVPVAPTPTAPQAAAIISNSGSQP